MKGDPALWSLAIAGVGLGGWLVYTLMQTKKQNAALQAQITIPPLPMGPGGQPGVLNLPNPLAVPTVQQTSGMWVPPGHMPPLHHGWY